MSRRLIALAHVYLSLIAIPEGRAQPSVVRVDGRQLIVQKRLGDGTLGPVTPYLMRGVNWSPASTNTMTTPTDPENVNRRRPELARWAATDLPMIRSMNANTIRIPMDPGLGMEGATGRAVLDACHTHGIMVVMTVDNGINDTNRVRDVVMFYRDHPAVLLWSLGNEWNINRYYGAASSVLEAAQRTEAAASLVKSLDPNHPVVSSYGEIDIDVPGLRLPDTAHYINEVCPSVDLWALNIYRGKSFGSLFAQWAGITAKPMFLGEFGIDAFRSSTPINPNPPGSLDEAQQAEWNVALWKNLARHLSARDPNAAALGGLVHEFNDQWWKIAPATSQQTGGLISPTGFPDGMSSEEIFGLCDIFRNPRAAFHAMRLAFDELGRPPGQSRTVLNLANSGSGSLRQAIADAQSGDTIAFASGLRGTLNFANEIRIEKDLTILGPGTNLLTFNGHNATRQFSISNGYAVTISDVTFARGSTADFGGAILNRGSLELVNCNFIDHFAGTLGDGAGQGGAIFSTGTLVVERCAFSDNRSSGNGGAIRSLGEFSLRESRFVNNRANYYGGAIYNFESGTLNGCYLTNNTAGPAGGGIWNENSGLALINTTLARNTAQQGGGLANKNGSVLIANCTFSGNRATTGGGGIFNGVFNEQGGNLVIANSTIVSNIATGALQGGGLRVSVGAVTLRSSILSGNTPTDLAGTIISGGFNLIGNAGGSPGWINSDQIGPDPLLATLEENGGPAPTHALAHGSPAIDRGNSFGRPSDQRGETRFDDRTIPNAQGGDGSDVGAYEIAQPRLTRIDFLVNDLTLEFTSTLGRNVVVQSRPSISSPLWAEAVTVPGNGGKIQATVPTGKANAFFRIAESR